MDDEIIEIFNLGMFPSVCSLIFQFLLYGTYGTLSLACISLQVQQHRLQKKKLPHPFYLISLITLFILATAGIILSVYDVSNLIQECTAAAADYTTTELLPWEKRTVNFRTAIGSVYATANCIADLILVYRCYHVWNGKIWIPLFPGLLSIINAGISYASIATTYMGSHELESATQHSREVTVGDVLTYIFLGVNVFENLLLTGLIAGRIWWVNRVHSKLLGMERRDKRLNAIVIMFVESGVIYPIALVVCLIIQVKGSTATMDPILLQIVGIAPTLILIRTLLGPGVDPSPPGSRRDQETGLGATFQASSCTINVKRTMPWTVGRRDRTHQPSSESYCATTTPETSLGSMQYGGSNDYYLSHPTPFRNSERINADSSPTSESDVP